MSCCRAALRRASPSCRLASAARVRHASFAPPLLSFTAPVAHSHRERRLVKFPARHVFAVVANVDDYRHFVPWCIDSKVRTRDASGNVMLADLAAGFQLFSERYTSRVVLRPWTSVIAEASDTQLFRKLRNEWSFAPGTAPASCWLSFKVDFEFRSVLYAHVSGLFMDEVVTRMVAAFERRCDALWQQMSETERRQLLLDTSEPAVPPRGDSATTATVAPRLQPPVAVASRSTAFVATPQSAAPASHAPTPLEKRPLMTPVLPRDSPPLRKPRPDVLATPQPVRSRTVSHGLQAPPLPAATTSIW